MKCINTTDAVGHVLCHDITRIVKDVVKDTAFRKGHIVTEEDIPVLLSLGKVTSMYGRRMKTLSMKMRQRRS